jgi:hypothetical protein
LQREIPRGDALGIYSNPPSYVCLRKQFREENTRGVCGRSFGAKLF